MIGYVGYMGVAIARLASGKVRSALVALRWVAVIGFGGTLLTALVAAAVADVAADAGAAWSALAPSALVLLAVSGLLFVAGGLMTIGRGWLGQYEDAGTGLTYLNARYYDPILGRFLSPDPLMNPGDPRTLDPYRYADNNPITFSDPLGLAPSCSGLTGRAYTNCNNYSQNTYNYATGLTVQQNNFNKNSTIKVKTVVRQYHELKAAQQSAESDKNYESTLMVGTKGAVNFFGGVANFVIGTANFLTSQVVPGCGLQYSMTGTTGSWCSSTQIPTIGIWGDESLYGASQGIGYWTGTAALTVATAGTGGAAAAGSATVRASTGARVFWSGGDEAMNAATQFAQSTRGLTVGMTPAGRVLSQYTTSWTYGAMRPLWERASASFARGAPTGQAAVAFFAKGAPYAKSIFTRIESPILQELGVGVIRVSV